MIIIIMGVSGCWKTTVGRALAQQLGFTFEDADKWHPPANLAKMGNHIPLTDEDRGPWLDALNLMLRECEGRRESVILACSALKQVYRDRLEKGVNIQWVHLRGTFAFIKKCLEERPGHFFKADMLESQFAILEEPRDAIKLDIDNATTDSIVGAICQQLQLEAAA